MNQSCWGTLMETETQAVAGLWALQTCKSRQRMYLTVPNYDTHIPWNLHVLNLVELLAMYNLIRTQNDFKQTTLFINVNAKAISKRFKECIIIVQHKTHNRLIGGSKDNAISQIYNSTF